MQERKRHSHKTSVILKDKNAKENSCGNYSWICTICICNTILLVFCERLSGVWGPVDLKSYAVPDCTAEQSDHPNEPADELAAESVHIF